MILKNDIILFIGDSITEAGRDIEVEQPNLKQALGFNLSFAIAGTLLEKYPRHNLKIYNRGISGNTIVDLKQRWQKDCFDLSPTLINILVGINDCAHLFVEPPGVTVSDYKKTYTDVLLETTKKIPNVRFVLCEPFAFELGTVTKQWLQDIKKRQKIVRTLATDFNAVFVPFQEILNNALKRANAEYWLDDGVHPSTAGIHLLAKGWIETICK